MKYLRSEFSVWLLNHLYMKNVFRKTRILCQFTPIEEYSVPHRTLDLKHQDWAHTTCVM
jgi:hypothetical protein